MATAKSGKTAKRGKPAGARKPAKAARRKTASASPPTPEGGVTAANESASGGAAADELLTADHRSVEALFRQYEETTEASAKKELAAKVCMELLVHAELEEAHFYPACYKKNLARPLLDCAQVEHDTAKVLIAEIMGLPADSPYYDAKVIPGATPRPRVAVGKTEGSIA